MAFEIIKLTYLLTITGGVTADVRRRCLWTRRSCKCFSYRSVIACYLL